MGLFIFDYALKCLTQPNIFTKNTNLCLSVETGYVDLSVIVTALIFKCETVAMSPN